MLVSFGFVIARQGGDKHELLFIYYVITRQGADKQELAEMLAEAGAECVQVTASGSDSDGIPYAFLTRIDISDAESAGGIQGTSSKSVLAVAHSSVRFIGGFLDKRTLKATIQATTYTLRDACITLGLTGRFKEPSIVIRELPQLGQTVKYWFEFSPEALDWDLVNMEPVEESGAAPEY